MVHFRALLASTKQGKEGQEFWSARKLAKALGYSDYAYFLLALERAKELCKRKGLPITTHFEATPDGSDIHLSQQASLFVILGSPTKFTLDSGEPHFSI